MSEKRRSKKAKDGKVGAVLVVGGGISGMQSSLDLASSGFKVYLLDSSPTIGGVMAQLDKTFPTNDCAMCIMAPKLVESGRHLNVEVLTNAEVKGIKGEPGNFEVEVLKKARYIDVEKCTGCGVCAQQCPVDAINSFNEGLSERRAIYIKYPQAVPLAYFIDRQKCIGCGLCENLCLADAVNYEDQDSIETLDVGAVILSPGFEEFDAKLKGEYGYGIYPNVVTSIEFERILSASGPYLGYVLRPSDGDIPKKVAFIQCVGSRDVECGNEYCSAVCCMYAIKEAVIAKEHAGADLDVALFFMDMRAYGKGFDAYYERAQDEQGVRFIRCNVCSIEEVAGTHDLRIAYETPDDLLVEEDFNLVVLSVGLTATTAHRDLADALGIQLNSYGFCKTHEFEPMRTSRPGLFVSGVFQGPKDIPESVTQASGAASEAAGLLASERGTLVTVREYPPELDVSGQEPRIGVFVCHCGINIGGFLDVPQVVEYARSLDGVVYAEDNLYTCSQDTQQRIVEKIKEHDLNRVVVASCTPRTHEPLFQETVREAGLNPHLFEMANIRDQCSWIHMHEPEQALEKAKDLVRMAVAKARLIEPLKALPLDVVQKALVIGGGLAGMTAALSVADQGYEVCLVEKEKELGGNLKDLYYTLENGDVQGYLKCLIKKVEENPRINVYKGAEIEKIDGFVGNFKTALRPAEGRKLKGQSSPRTTRKTQDPGRTTQDAAHKTQEAVEIEHGVVIVATGAKEYQPKEYLFGKDARVITQRQLEKRLADGGQRTADLRTVVMIQCVGSRNGEHPYCSRVCCSHAVKNALKLKEKHPEAEITVLYRDMRTYGFREIHYREANESGVIFVRYDKEEPPDVISDGNGLKVCSLDPILHENLVMDADLVVLSPCIVPQDSNEVLSRLLKVPLNEDGYFLEAHVKLRPVDFATEGVFLAGMAHGPKSIDETICQAKAAASRACTIVSQEKYMAEPTIAAVNEDICDGCGICEAVCEYGAIEIVAETVDGEEKKKAKLTEALCKGCGGCVAACPSGAMEQKGFKSEQLLAMVDAALE